MPCAGGSCAGFIPHSPGCCSAHGWPMAGWLRGPTGAAHLATLGDIHACCRLPPRMGGLSFRCRQGVPGGHADHRARAGRLLFPLAPSPPHGPPKRRSEGHRPRLVPALGSGSGAAGAGLGRSHEFRHSPRGPGPLRIEGPPTEGKAEDQSGSGPARAAPINLWPVDRDGP